LPTSYEDFIFNYTKEEINDNFVNSKTNANNYFKLKLYDDKEFNLDSISNINTKESLIKIVREYFIFKNLPFTFPTKLITKANGENWSYIESFFYKELIFESGLKKSQKQDEHQRNRNLDDVKKLNAEFENVKLALQHYLTEYVENKYIFKPQKEFINKEYNDNSLFQHIKSFGYVKTNNYHKMESFVETEPYEIFIIGHSCGLSDRTLLKYLFDHDHCTSIKIFYYEEEKGNTKKSRDNHNYTAQEISRHFEDKAKMRSRIISFEDSVPCPQTPLEKKEE